MSRKPNGRKLRPREQQAIDAQKILAHLTRDGSLWDEASCAGTAMPDAWFPEMSSLTNEDIVITKMVLQTCDGCQIKDKCLQIGMQEDDIKFGIFGGLFAGERLALRNKLTGRRLLGLEEQQVRGAQMVRERINKLNGDV
jgi:hypothetical protein